MYQKIFALTLVLFTSSVLASELTVNKEQENKETKKICLIVDNIEKNIPIINDSYGNSFISGGELTKTTGVLIHDPGYVSTSSCVSNITYIDGDNGILRYRGYPIEELGSNSHHFDITYLLIFGTLPNQEKLAKFSKDILKYSQLEPFVAEGLSYFSHKTSPMKLLALGLEMLDTCEKPISWNLKTEQDRYEAITYILGQTLALSAHIFCHINGTEGESGLLEKQSYGYNALHLMGVLKNKEEKEQEELGKIFDTILLLHADHEQNASTSTVRQIASTGAGLLASLVGGVKALSGPLHGGANEEVLKMLDDIEEKENISEFLEKVKKKERLLMGFGHRVYKSYDPRAEVMKKICKKFLRTQENLDSKLEIALELEKMALEESYFKDRHLYPNVDFYSGILLKSMGIPKEMFTVIFALGRMAGWLAHWNEQIQDKSTKIFRPRQLYLGLQEQSLE
jgi:citrate synthase